MAVYAIIAILLCALIGAIIYNAQVRKIKILTLNEDIERQRIDKEKELQLLQETENSAKQELQQIYEDVDTATNRLAQINDQLDKTTEEYKQIAEERAQKAYKACLESLQTAQTAVIQDIQSATREELKDYQLVQNQLALAQNKIKELEAAQIAHIQAKQREEEMQKKQDYYRLVLSDEAKQDIRFLREAQSHLGCKDSIDKIIWDVYYKPAYDILMSHIFTSASDKRCGIYRISCLTNDKAYIGQSVDIRDRWKQHIKSALSYASTQNKLYNEMKSQGVENFTFEILEEVPRPQLNEREIYWIDFYKTRDYGLNSTKGGS